MCFLSICRIEDGLVITHNRDESVNRPLAQGPQEMQLGKHTIIAPLDVQSGGTWIASTKNETLAILNGGRENHIKKPNYLSSRGKLIANYFKSNLDYEVYLDAINYSDYEPFTLIRVCYDDFQIIETIWDGKQNSINKKTLRSEAVVYSSATLYSAKIRYERNTYFNSCFEEAKSVENIFELHNKAGENLGTNFRVTLNEHIKTVSIYQISINEIIKIRYKDFLTNKFLMIDSRLSA
ncbi:MAG TPA: NRDE family protein [Saprospiraceae bacterium]|nr:NRDE family protein [Saprospiraceae bacterium]